MTARSIGIGLVVAAALAGVAWWVFATTVGPHPVRMPESPAERSRSAPAAAATAGPVVPEHPDEGPGRSTLADELNAPAGTIERDLAIVDQVFAAWRTNFPHQGNPVGENAEITSALTGANPLRLPLIPRGHRAVNAAGELCDRWGTPFFFHQLSGTRMEVRSAGPDRRLHTADDVALNQGTESGD